MQNRKMKKENSNAERMFIIMLIWKQLSWNISISASRGSFTTWELILYMQFLLISL